MVFRTSFVHLVNHSVIFGSAVLGCPTQQAVVREKHRAVGSLPLISAANPKCPAIMAHDSPDYGLGQGSLAEQRTTRPWL
jgi:hypothetical protein